jgi:multiple sugar transport system permease protein
LASSDSPLDMTVLEPDPSRVRASDVPARRGMLSLGALRSEGSARWVFIWPTVLVILALSIFPLVASLALSVSRLVFERGSLRIDFVGLTHYTSLLLGSERTHTLGLLKPPNVLGWLLVGAAAVFAVWWLGRGARAHLGPFSLAVRLGAGLVLVGFAWLLAQTLFSEGGRPGSLVVTMLFVLGGITLQYLLGLGLAILAVQRLPGRRFFRVVFLIPLTITPVGAGYLFRMVTDTGKGPIEPIWAALGLQQYSWVNDPWAARVAVIIAESWQWIPFMFIVLLAALEARDHEVLEASAVDGASHFASFRHISMPAILPVSTTLILIRMIESFKIIDMPNILLGGGPGTATQSLTLQAYIDWRALNLGRSAALAYILLIVVTLVATAYVSFVRRRATQVV